MAARKAKRGGLPDPAWQQGGIALIAIGAFLVAAIGVTDADRPAGQARGVWETRGLWAGFVITGLGVLLILVSLVMAWRRWLDDRKSPLEMVYDPDDTECYYSGAPNTRQLRVRVTNTGSVGVERVRVHSTPERGHGLHSHFLHLRHDNEPLRRLSREGEYMTVGQVEYWDVAYWPGGCWKFNYADPGIEDAVAFTTPKTLRLRLVASGWRDSRDVVPLVKDFDVTFGPQPGEMSMAEVK